MDKTAIKPLVAIVGRPNVGKSTFFNRMAGRRISIVKDVPGVTRDRLYADAEWCGYEFSLVDTGGIEIHSQDTMWTHIRRQAELAMELADVILFMVDGRQEVTADDIDVADMLRRTKKPVVLAANKIDNQRQSAYFEFYKLGLGEPIPISSELGLNLGDLLDEIVKNLKKTEPVADLSENAPLKLAVVGKPNVGKSSLINRLLGYERTIVTDIAGTTRDAVDTPIIADGKEYVLIDTAGLRKKSRVDGDVEYYGNIRSIDAIRRADAVAVVIDASEEISEQDVRICGIVHESKKPSVIIMNKWDAVEKDGATVNRYNDKLREALKFMDYFKPLYISALTGKRVNLVLDSLREVHEKASQRVSTGILNEVLHDAIAMNQPPSSKGRSLKIYFITQASANPPSFVLFVNDPVLMHFSYKRYIENALRKAFDFAGTPITLIIRSKKEMPS